MNLNNFSFAGNDKTYDIFYLQNEEGELLTPKKIFVQKRETALAFLKKGVEIGIISECTGLTIKQIEDLK